MPPGDMERYNLKDLTVGDFYDKLPKHSFSLAEWIDFGAHETVGTTVSWKNTYTTHVCFGFFKVVQAKAKASSTG